MCRHIGDEGAKLLDKVLRNVKLLEVSILSWHDEGGAVPFVPDTKKDENNAGSLLFEVISEEKDSSLSGDIEPSA